MDVVVESSDLIGFENSASATTRARIVAVCLGLTTTRFRFNSDPRKFAANHISVERLHVVVLDESLHVNYICLVGGVAIFINASVRSKGSSTAHKQLTMSSV